MWNARTKNDLVIEVWEKLDCENIGAAEIEAIEVVVEEQYGKAAVDSPMIIARLLADEGADLRHSEIMELYVRRASDRPYDAAFRGVLRIDDLKAAAASIRDLENLRSKYETDQDKEGLRMVRETGIQAKEMAAKRAQSDKLDAATRQINSEIVQWFTIWLQAPALFQTWLDLRRQSADFKDTFVQRDGSSN